MQPQFRDLLLNGEKRVAEVLLEMNREQSRKFVDAKLSRQTYRSIHSTQIAWMKCMDGRINGAVITETPPGIISPFRSAGARFDLGWPYFMDKVSEEINYASSKGRRSLFFCTYHYSKGSHDRGCKAFNFDTEAAKASAFRLRQQFEDAFPGPDRVVHAIVVGLETDEDALVLHSPDGQTMLNLADLDPAQSEQELSASVQRVYPTLPAQIMQDLLPLLLGNLRHIAEIRDIKREPEELNHREIGLFLGRGFPWLHTPNRAIIIGPWEGWKHELAVGGHILLDNLREKRIPEGTRPVFMVSAPYRELGSTEHRFSPFKARFLYRDGLEILKKEVPELIPHLDFLVGTVYQESLLFEQLQTL